MGCRLPKPEKRLQHLHLRARQPLSGHRGKQRLSVMIPELVVEAPLRRLEIAVNRLLDFFRQLRRHLLLGSSENERPQRPGEQVDLYAVCPPRPDGPAEGSRRSQKAGVEELEQAPDLAEMI